MSNKIYKSRTRMRALFLTLMACWMMGFNAVAQVTAAFTYTGGNQTFTVPPGNTTIDVKIWGAGGGGNTGGPSSGGSSAFVKGTLAVTPGQTYVIVVGGGGNYNSSGASVATFGGGGASGAANGSTGGGYSGIFLTSVSQANAKAICGGGGGGGYHSAVAYGGAGGATTGNNGGNVSGVLTGGAGATVGAGGSGGVGNTNGAAGTALTGGTGGTNTSGGSGGGGGYFGGGGGYGGPGSPNYASGGGGGSSFLGTLTSSTNTIGVNSNGTTTTATQAPGSAEVGYIAGIGNGGSSATPQAGNGLVLVTFIPSPLSGTKTIDNTLPTAGNNYASFSAAISDLNVNGVGAGGVTFNVTSGQTFTENPSSISATGTLANQIIFQKNGAGANPIITASGSTGVEAAILINGGDYLTFDGINIATATTTLEYGYYMQNASATNGAQNNTIKNCTVTLNRTNGASIGIIQFIATTPTSTAGANSNNKYYNFTVKNANAGVLLSGNVAFPDLSCEVGTTACATRNTIGDPATTDDILYNGAAAGSTYGVRAINQGSVKIYNCDIQNVTTSINNSQADGIFIDNSAATVALGTCEVYNNKVSTISSSSTGTNTNNVIRGIRVNGNAFATTITRVYNNFIWNLQSGNTNTTLTIRRIIGLSLQPAGSGAASGIYCEFNSVRIGASNLAVSNTCLEIGTGSGPIFRVRNNILSNVTAAQSGSAKHYCWISTTTATVGAAGSLSNYNDLYVTGTNGFVGLGNITDYATLANWQTATSNDANSISTDPLFVSSTNLHVTAVALNNGADPAYATNTAWATVDIDCTTRPVTTDIGADEISVSNCSSANGGTISPSTVSKCNGQTYTMSSVGADAGTGITYQWEISSTGGGVGFSNVSGGTGAATTSYTTAALTTGVYYYRLHVTCSFGPINGFSNELTVTVNGLPTVIVTPTPGNALICGTGSVSMTASGATSYVWSPTTFLTPSNGLSSTEVSAATTTTAYSVIGTDANGCTGSASQTVTVGPAVTLNSVTATPAAVCSGGTSVLSTSVSTTPVLNYTVASISPSAETPSGTPTNLVVAGVYTPAPQGTAVTPQDDGYWDAIALPFTFNFYGTGYTTVRISTNGNVQFGAVAGTAGNPGAASWTPQTIPTAGGNLDNFIGGPWMDQDLRTATGGTLRYFVNGVAPNRKFVISYEACKVFSSSDANTSQIILNENGSVDVLLLGGGLIATTAKAIGIENAGGTLGVAAPGRNSGTWTTAADEAWRFSPAAFNYAWLPATGLTPSASVASPTTPALFANSPYSVTVTEPVSGCTATGGVTVNINTAPTVSCPANQTANTSGACTAVVTYSTSSTGTPAPAITYAFTGATTGSGSGNGSGSTFNVGVTTVQVTATNSCGTQNCSFTVTVTDNENPVITCPATANISTNAGLCTSNASIGTATATDNCTVASIVASPAGPYTVGPHTITWTATDNHGNIATCLQTVNVTDGENPIISCPATANILTDGGLCTSSASIGTATATDNCSVASVVASPAGPYSVGSHSITWTATDINGNTVTCTQTVTVIDGENPVISCPATANISSDAGLCTSSASIGTATATDNCLVSSLVAIPAGPYSVGSHTITWTAIDVSGNIATCTQTVNVTDGENPVISCPATANISTDAGLCTSSASIGTATATDNCSVASVIASPAGPYSVGAHTITWTATDVNGNTASCSQTVNVTDGENPVITCPSNITTCNTTVTFSVTATDNCSVASVVSTPASGSTFPVGTTTVNSVATDVNGNTSNCSFTVTVSPAATAGTVSGNSPVCAGYTEPYTATGGDAGGTWSTGNSLVATVDAFGVVTAVGAGTTSVTYTVNVGCGAPVSSSQNITVTVAPACQNGGTVNASCGCNCPPGYTGVLCEIAACTPPVFTVCATNQSANTAGLCSAVVNYTTTVTGTSPTVTYTFSGATTATGSGDGSGSIFNVGVTTVTVNATNGCGSDVCTFTVTVTDNENPVVTCPATANITADAGLCTSSGSIGTATATDNCSVASVVASPAGPYSVGTHTITWTATDASGNTATCTQTVNVTDNQNPVITCPATANITTDAGLCTSSASIGTASATDNCSVASVVASPAGPYSVGTHTITWTATDVNGNTATCSQTVNVTDNQNPVITCPSNITTCNTVVTFSVTATDNCSVASVVSTPASGSTFTVGTTTVNSVATDVNGNTSTCSFTVTVNPAATAGTVSGNSPVCAGYTEPYTATGGDAGGTWSTGNSLVATVDAFGVVTAVGAGTTSVTYTVNVGCGAPVSSSQNITVTAAPACQNGGTVNASCGCNCPPGYTGVLCEIAACTPPVFTVCATNQSANTAGLCSAVVNYTTTVTGTSPTVTYTFSGATTATGSGDGSGSIFNVGVTTVTVNATNGCGSDVCTFTVTVTDNENPVVTCPATANITADAGLCTSSGSIGIATATDNCSVASVVASPAGPYSVGTHTITWTATDVNGNTATCTQTVNVTDNQNPVITCPSNILTCNSTVTFSVTATDNCSVASVVSTPASGSTFPVGTTTVNSVATDVNGNTSTCSFTVTVSTPSTAPTSATTDAPLNNICVGNSVNLTVNGGSLGTGASWKWYSASCGGTPVGTGATVNVSPAVTTTYFVRAEGGCGNTACVSVTVNVSSAPVTNHTIMPFTGMPANLCNGTTATLSVAPVLKATFYVWDAPTGSYFNGNPLNVSPYTTATPSVTITFGNPGGSMYQIGVQAGNACGSSVRQSQGVRGIVSVPAAVSGPLTACANSSISYTTGAVTGATSYLWTVTGDATVSGTGTTASVTFGPAWNGGTLCVAAQTTCYTSPTKCITISKSAASLGAISGTFTACPNSTLTYSVPASAGAASYTWTLPSGSSGSSTTNSINVTFGPGYNATGSICVSVTSICGVTSAVKCKTVAPGLPTVPASISGPANGLCGQSVVYTCPSQGVGVTYNWSVPAGASIVSGQGTTSVNVQYGTFTTGSLCVTASNGCGTSASRCITVKGSPATPLAITATPSSWCANTPGIEFNVNVSNVAGAYTLSWTYPTAPVATYTLGGGNSTQLILDWLTGTGNVNVTASNACGSGTKTSTWSSTCREGSVATVSSLVVSPNPTTGILNINYTASKGNTLINVTDLTGRVVMTQATNSVEGSNNTQLDMSKLAKGAYMLSVQSTQGNKQIKVVVE